MSAPTHPTAERGGRRHDIVGCDFHTRQQHVAVLDTETGEVQACRLAHDDQPVEHFHASLPRPVTVGIESTGYAQWFHALMQRQGHTLLVGDAARISRHGRAQDQDGPA